MQRIFLSIAQALKRDWQIAAVAGSVVFFIAILGVLFFLRGRMLMQEELRSRLRDTAAMAAAQFEANEVERVQGSGSLESKELRDLVGRLGRIRQLVPSIRFAYIMRKTKEPMLLEFVADADSLSTVRQLDLNHNGALDPDEQPSYPGDTYDISGVPALQREAFLRPSVDAAITYDKWGALISGYAPIRDAAGHAVAVLGIDMKADDYLMLTQSIFSPVLMLLLAFVAVLLGGFILSFLWRRRVDLYHRIEEERAGMMLLASHQLGTPLTIFQWTLEALRDSEEKQTLAEDLQGYLSNMDTGIAHLSSILQQLRKATDIEQGHVVYVPDWAYLREIIMQVVHDASAELKSNKQKINMDLADMHLRLDKNLIANVMRELLTNAINFSRASGAIAIVSRRAGTMALVEVRDHGIGVPRKDLSRVFGKFVRASNAHLSHPDGNGLGLYIARGIIRQAGGEMWMESKEGEGTSVFFTLPFKQE